MNNLKRRISQLEQFTRSSLHDLTDDELERRIKDLEKREYTITSVEQLQEKIQQIEEVIQRKTGQGFRSAVPD
jgi:chaperonin cofactor prefoldin